MTDTVIAKLRPHVLVLGSFIGGSPNRRLGLLGPAFTRWQRQLVRVGGCADIDTLTAAFLGGEALRQGIEALHRKQAIPGISSIRSAFKKIEAVLDRVPLSTIDQEPLPDPLLDVPTSGLLAVLWQRVEKRCRADSTVAKPKAKPKPRKISVPATRRAACSRKQVPSQEIALKRAA